MSLAWFDGALHADEISISPRDRGLTLGDGLFETILVRGKKAVWLEEHHARMRAAAAVLGIHVPEEELQNGVAALVDLARDAHVLRVMLTRGVTLRGLAAMGEDVSVIATLDHFDETMMFKPVELITTAIRRNASSPASSMKTLSYIDNILAAQDAKAKGVEDALMLNSEGNVCCTTMANLFLLKDEKLHTPRLEGGVLPGITRAKILALFGAEQRDIAPDELLTADAVFTTNSLRMIRQVTSLDGQKLKQGELKHYDAVLAAALG